MLIVFLCIRLLFPWLNFLCIRSLFFFVFSFVFLAALMTVWPNYSGILPTLLRVEVRLYVRSLRYFLLH